MTQTHAKALTPWIVALMVPAMIISLFAVAIMLAPGADAHDMPKNWSPPRTASWVGTCGSNRKNLVFAVQAMLLEGTDYFETGRENSAYKQFDGAIGTATKDAIKEFQRDHSLDDDGCVGPTTWNKFRYNSHFLGGITNPWKEIHTAAQSSHTRGFEPEFDWDGSKWHFEIIHENIGYVGGEYWCDYTLNSNDVLCDHSGGVCAGSRIGSTCL